MSFWFFYNSNCYIHGQSWMRMQSSQNWSTITLIMHIRVYCIRISLTLKLLLYLGSIEVQVEVFVSTAASLRSRFPTPSDCEGCCCYLGGSLVFKVTRSCHLLWNYPKNTGFSFFSLKEKPWKGSCTLYNLQSLVFTETEFTEPSHKRHEVVIGQ